MRNANLTTISIFGGSISLGNDNKHLFTYGLLFQYLHLIIEGKNPLDAFHRSAGQCHGVLGTTSDLEDPSLSQEAFARLLDLKFSGNFQSPVCGCSPETIICDGTLVGFRKDLLPALQRSIL